MDRGDEAIYVKSPDPLPPYAVKLTERLEHWATLAPERFFLAEREGASKWRKVSYSEMLYRVRSIAQGLLNRGLNRQTPVLILSGNSIEHASLALGCMYCGVPYAPVSPSCLRDVPELTWLRRVWKQIEPALVFASAAEDCNILKRHVERIPLLSFDKLVRTQPSSSVHRAHADVSADTVAKIMFTSGTTGTPKGVITTHRMLCSNQEMIRSVLTFLAVEPPVLCDWLPWNHVFGGSHNFGIALYNGGTLFIDGGKPTTPSFEKTLVNLSEVATTVYLNVPKGYRMLVPALQADPPFARHFFSRLKAMLCAGAGLDQSTWDEMQRLAVKVTGREILLVNALGSTESAPLALASRGAHMVAGRVGLPVPGVKLKLVRVDGTLEARLRGPNITPGFWRDPDRDARSFDEEGFYKTGDALRFAEASRLEEGFVFDRRLSADFKLSTGTWVDASALRDKLLSCLQGLATEVVLAGPDRDYVTALIFAQSSASREEVRSRLEALVKNQHEPSQYVRHALLIDDQLSAQAGEITEKGTINQEAVLLNRAALVEELYRGSQRVIEVT